MEPSPTRRAKEAYVVADTLKTAPFHSHEAFLASLENVERSVALWLDCIDLDRCVVWRHMGDRPWAEGFVISVAELFRCYEPQQSRIWGMETFSELFSSRLPLIVSVLSPTTFMIDDGSHRAIAMALAGVRSALAWIGELYERG